MPTPRSGAPSGDLSSVPSRLAPTLLSRPSENFNESRNDFGYRPGCVFTWWRRLVLGARARLTRPVLEWKLGILERTQHVIAVLPLSQRLTSESRPIFVHRMAILPSG